MRRPRSGPGPPKIRADVASCCSRSWSCSVVIFVVSRGCQQIADPGQPGSRPSPPPRRRSTSSPSDNVVRLLRQGLTAKPFWFVVLYTRTDGELVPRAQVTIDAKTGEVTKVTRARRSGKAKQPEP